MKYVKVEDAVHQGLKMYCVANNKEMQTVASEWITERLLKEAGVNGSTD